MKQNLYSILLGNIAIFNPKGLIADQQRDLIVTVVLLMLIAVVPFLFLAYFFAWKYRVKKQSKYTPNIDQNQVLQLSWIGLLSVIIITIGSFAWKSSHALDPRQPIESEKTPITIQVVSLEWKWLFLYPEQNIASVNFLQFPEDTPINLEITADAPMNSFLIPQLGGQMYAMNGMKTKLHLMANEIGEYRGFSSNLSGEGFSGMRFFAKVSSEQDFLAWVETTKFYGNELNYEELAKPSKNNSPTTYRFGNKNLFGSIIMKFMTHPTEEHSKH
jgi:cytochrome o ubiquinol oxidase subunit 2